jgi:hypothetical protein
MPADYPSSIPSFTTVSGGDVVSAAMFNRPYEEIVALATQLKTLGTWTPVIGGATSQSGQSYTTQVGYYVQVGKIVVAQATILLSNKGTITGAVVLRGLPVAGANVSAGYSGTVHFGHFTGMATNWSSLHGIVNDASTSAEITGVSAAGTGASSLAASDIDNTTLWVLTAIYLTD